MSSYHVYHAPQMIASLLWIISLSQVGVVAVVGDQGGAIASAIIAGIFLTINTVATVFLTRYLNRHDESVRQAVQKLPKRHGDKDNSDNSP